MEKEYEKICIYIAESIALQIWNPMRHIENQLYCKKKVESNKQN